MKISFAACYSRQAELRIYSAQLLTIGHLVVSPWVDSLLQIDGTGVPIPIIEPEVMFPSLPNARKAIVLEKLALDEFRAVFNSEMLIVFTNPPEIGQGRGGASVEMGIAIAQGKPIVIVGPRINLFHWLPDLHVFSTFEEVFLRMKGEAGKAGKSP